MDAGTPMDAGMDSGTPDSGTTPDGGSTDAGRPDSGSMDAGTPDSGSAGRPAADSGAPGAVNPDAVGERCTGACGNALVCYAEDGDPPGICVPRCSSLQRDCPDDYRCSTGLGACIPDDQNDDENDDDTSTASCTCSLRPVGGASNQLWGSLATAAVGIVILRRRRRA